MANGNEGQTGPRRDLSSILAEIVNQATGQCLDVKDKGAKAALSRCDKKKGREAEHGSQGWAIDQENNFDHIENGGSKGCLGRRHGSRHGGEVILSTCRSGPDQRWLRTELG
jgi:ricin-type beta-trefoil lectin protein